MNRYEVAAGDERAIFCGSQKAALARTARRRRGALLAIAVAVVAAVLVAAPVALAGTVGASFFSNSVTGLDWIHVKNTSAGVTLNSIDFTLGSGAISGTPTADSAGTFGGGSCTKNTAQSASCTFSPTLAPTNQGDADNEIGGVNAYASPPTNPGTISYTAHFGDGSTASGTANQCPSSITLTPPPGSLPDGTVGSPYNLQMSGPSGTTYKQGSGGRAPGVTLSQYGLWSGTPTQGGSYGVQLNVYDASACPFFPNYTFKINDAPGSLCDPQPGASTCSATGPCPETPPLTITNPDAGAIGQGHEKQFTAAGGTPPYTFSATRLDPSGQQYAFGSSGRSPGADGLTSDPQTGKVSYTGSDTAGVAIRMTVTDKAGCTAQTIWYSSVAGPSLNPPVGRDQTLPVSGGTARLPVECPAGSDCLFALTLFSKDPCPPSPPIGLTPLAVGPPPADYGIPYLSHLPPLPLTVTGGKPGYLLSGYGSSPSSGASVTTDGKLEISDNPSVPPTQQKPYPVRVTVIDSTPCASQFTIEVNSKSGQTWPMPSTPRAYRASFPDSPFGQPTASVPSAQLAAFGKQSAKRRRAVKLGFGTARLPAGKKGVLKIKLMRAARALLARRGRLPMHIAGTTTRFGTVAAFDVAAKLKATRHK